MNLLTAIATGISAKVSDAIHTYGVPYTVEKNSDRKRYHAGPSGAKLAKQSKKGTVGLAHGCGGIIAQAIREMQRAKFLAKQANK